MPKPGRILAYVVTGIPAAIGAWFVARSAFVTSDTVIDGAGNAFLFGMIAMGAYAGPAIALAVAGRGRKVAASVWGLLALFAIVTNWTLTLGALANRGAGTEAERVKLAATVADDRARLTSIGRERGAMVFVATDADTVKAAEGAAKAAERVRVAECERSALTKRCRDREVEEQEKLGELARARGNKALTDQVGKLDAEAAAIRARLDKAPAVKDRTPSARRSGAYCRCPPRRPRRHSNG